MVLGQDHALHDGQALRLEEHVLGAAQADAYGAVGAGAAGILGIIGIGPHLQAGGRPAARRTCGCRAWRRSHPPRSAGSAGRSVLRCLGATVGILPTEDFAGGAIHGDPFAFFDHLVANGHLALFQVDLDGGSADHAGDAELAGNHSGVGGGAAFAGQKPLEAIMPCTSSGLVKGRTMMTSCLSSFAIFSAMSASK